jgi:heme/copper-type cytochrome/quinol oxidase subunit 2
MMPTITSALSTATPVQRPLPTAGKIALFVAIGGIMVVIVGVLVFMLRRYRSH